MVDQQRPAPEHRAAPRWAHGVAGRRILVVGASSGIGRAIAVAAAAAGAAVALAARRAELLEAAAGDARRAASSAGDTAPSIAVIVCDAADEQAALGVAGAAADALGGLDTVIYAAGISVLAPLSELGADQWSAVLSTNVVGAALVSAGALEPLRAAEGRGAPVPTVAFLSSHVVPRPPPGLVSYAASKAGLDALARGLREEEPWLRVVNVVVGNTVTSFAASWDREAAGAAVERWLDEGYLDDRIFTAEQMADFVLSAVADVAGPLDVSAVEPSAPVSAAARPPAR